MYFKFGAYQHPSSEVNLTSLEVTTRFSPRNREMTKFYRLHCRGALLATGQAALNTAIAQLIDAYSLVNMDQTAGLYHDDGTVTRHRIESSATNAANISGVRLAYRSWPKGEPEEYATERNFYHILEAEYRNLESQLIDFNETVRKEGTGGPRYRYTEFQTIAPRRELINQFTTQRIIQEGYAVGFDAYITPPGPLLPALEDEDMRLIRLDSPQQMGRAFTHYRSSWRYVMTSPINQSVLPNII